MISALKLALWQFPDLAFRRVVLRAIFFSILLFVAMVIAVGYGISQLELIGFAWVNDMIALLGGAAAFVVGLILFPGMVALVISLFLEDIAKAVEAKHYPNLPPPRSQPMHEALIDALRLAGIAIAFNILALPLYIIPGVNAVLFFGVNGYFLGREYFELVAARRLRMASIRKLRRTHGPRLIIAGVVITFLLSIPVINCVMSVVAVAFMVHLFEHLRDTAEG